MSKRIKFYRIFVSELKNPTNRVFNLIRKMDKKPHYFIPIFLIRYNKEFSGHKKNWFLKVFKPKNPFQL